MTVSDAELACRRAEVEADILTDLARAAVERYRAAVDVWKAVTSGAAVEDAGAQRGRLN